MDPKRAILRIRQFDRCDSTYHLSGFSSPRTRCDIPVLGTVNCIDLSVQYPILRARRKPININILGGTVFGTNRNRPWDKRDPSLGQTGTRPLDKPGPVPKVPWTNRDPFVLGTGRGSSLGRLSRKDGQKYIYVFCVYWFVSPPNSASP